MASKRFRIPTLEEMENADTDKEAPEPLFKRRKELETPEHDSSTSAVRRIDGTVPSNILTDLQSGKPASKSTSSWSSNNISAGIKPQTKDCTTMETIHNNDDSNGTSGNIVSCDVVDSESSNGVQEAQKVLQTGSKPGSSNSLIVNTRQRGNPILKSVRNIPWEYGNIVPDYVMGQTNCALFLSLRYHQLHPNYIHERLKLLGRSYDLRVMLVQVDVKEPHHLLKDLAKICLLADCTLILAFSPEEAGRYLETYKIFENKPPEAIMERTEENFMAKFTDCLTRVKSVNKTDCATLISHFGSLANIMEASEEDLSLCPGFGPQKARRLHSIFHEPFLRSAGKGKT